jgi:NAD(P)-dependent dehydrogenase (short-subunit alcohol dehydrogenase family)
MSRNRRVLVTGASKGLGLAAAKAFARAGDRVALVARSRERLASLCTELEGSERHLVLAADLLLVDELENVVSRVHSEWDGADVLVHCVGGSYGMRTPVPPREELLKLVDLNLGIAAALNHAFVPGMVDQGSGNIIHVGSKDAFEATPAIAYNVAKAALSGYVRALGNELVGKGIVVTGILPGAFFGDENAMFRFRKYKPAEYEEFKQSLPGGRMPQAEDLVPLLMLLASSEALPMAGSLICADGGQARSFFSHS